MTDPATRDRLAADERAQFAQQGWTLLRGLLAADRVAALRDEVLGVLAGRNMADSFLAQTGEYLAGGAIDAWVNSARLRALAADVLGGPSRVYMPFSAVKGPGQGAFTFHQDNNYTRLRGPACNCWLALVPMRVANGALRLVDGSHRDGTWEAQSSAACPGHREVVRTPQTWTDVAMEPGDVCLFDRLTVHGSGPNTTAAPRVAYAVQFHHDDTEWLDAEAGAWRLLRTHPRYPAGPVAALSRLAGRGE